LPRAVPAHDVAAMRARIWNHLERAHAIREREPGTWPATRPFQLQALSRSDAFAPVRCPALVATLEELLGRGGWQEPPNWGPPLVSFRDCNAWHVPTKSWHLDLPITHTGALRAVRAFTFLTDVDPHGGATVAVAGSHRVLAALAERAGRELRSREAREALGACDPWFAALEAPGSPGDREQRFLRDGACVLGVPVRVVELCGHEGDIALMRAELLHAAAPHALPAPRMVLAPFVYAR
jgi:ectoine hydroxylase-related dioxygenase (phytanoyl-CoA dioxygenase family)